MFNKMRRIEKAMKEEEAVELLKNGEYGVLSIIGSHGYPYGVPVNYVFRDGFIYFHCAREGEKIDCIAENDKISFCVVGKTEIVEEKFTTKYESVILFGRACIVEDDKEKKDVLFEMIKKYSPNYTESGKRYIANDFNKTHIVKIKIEHITGKKTKE